MTSGDNVEHYIMKMRLKSTNETERSTLPDKVSTKSLASARRSTGLALAPLEQLSPSQVQKRHLSQGAPIQPGASASETGRLCVLDWRAFRDRGRAVASAKEGRKSHQSMVKLATASGLARLYSPRHDPTSLELGS